MKHLSIAWFTLFVIVLIGCDHTSNTNNPVVNQADGKSISITDSSDRTVSFDDTPKKIITLGNGELDIINALGGNLVGRPTGTLPTHLNELKDLMEVGSAHGIDLEKVTMLRSDVVLGNNPMNIKDVPAIEAIGAKMVLTEANSVDDVKNQIQLFGQLLQEENRARDITDTIDEKITAIQSNQSSDKKRVLLVYGAPGTNMAALPNSLSGSLVELAGGENIASDFASLANYPQYAQLNAERIIESNPQFILFMGHGDPEKVRDGFIKEMKQTAGWQHLEAVQNNHFEILPPDLFGTNPGTRVVDALDYLDKLFQEAKD